MYTLNDVIKSIIGLYPGKSQDIYAYAKRGGELADSLELKDKDRIDFIEFYIRDKLD